MQPKSKKAGTRKQTNKQGSSREHQRERHRRSGASSLPSDDESWGPQNRRDFEKMMEEEQNQAGNLSPLTDDGSQHQEKRRRPRSGDGDDEGAGGNDRNPPPPTPPPSSPPPDLYPPPAVSATTNLNTTNIPQTIFHDVDAKTVRKWINEHQAHRAANMNTNASSQLGQNALAKLAAIFSSAQCRGLWPVGEEPRMLFPNMDTRDNMKIRALIDANTEELFRILQERYPEKEADASNCYTTACNTHIPLDRLPTHSVIDLRATTISNFFFTGQFTIDLELNELEHDQSLLTNTEMLLPSVQHISERQREKPCVILRLNDEYTDKCFEHEVLIDPASYQTNGSQDEDVILSYVSRKLANKIITEHGYALKVCSCKPATTCTSTGCFISNNCITLNCILYDQRTRTNEISISFRIVETLGNNDMIIGLTDVRKHDLTTVFKHIYTHMRRKTNNTNRATN